MNPGSVSRNEPGAVMAGRQTLAEMKPVYGTAFASNRRAWILSSLADNLYPMPEARDLATNTELLAAELAWLNARLEEYRDLLQYLRDH